MGELKGIMDLVVAQPSNVVERTASEMILSMPLHLLEEIAAHKDTPADVLAILAQDKFLYSSLARNENCPAALLVTIAQLQDNYVQMGLVGNKNCPSEVLDILVKSEYIDIRYEAIDHKNITSEILTALAKHPDEDLRDLAQYKLASILEAGEASPVVSGLSL